jgi:hypothetical protein
MANYLMRVATALCVTVMAAAWQPARAMVELTLQEDGLGDVTFMGSGTLDITGLEFDSTDAGAGSIIRPAAGEFQIYPAPSNHLVKLYSGVTAPANFGSGGQTFADAVSGYVLSYIGEQLGIDTDYVDGTPFVTSATFLDTDLAALGVTPGVYTWSWGGDDGDSIVLTVVAPIPEPNGALAVMLPLAALIATRRRWFGGVARSCAA